jgi:hypothetical protein
MKTPHSLDLPWIFQKLPPCSRMSPLHWGPWQPGWHWGGGWEEWLSHLCHLLHPSCFSFECTSLGNLHILFLASFFSRFYVIISLWGCQKSSVFPPSHFKACSSISS